MQVSRGAEEGPLLPSELDQFGSSPLRLHFARNVSRSVAMSRKDLIGDRVYRRATTEALSNLKTTKVLSISLHLLVPRRSKELTSSQALLSFMPLTSSALEVL